MHDVKTYLLSAVACSILAGLIMLTGQAFCFLAGKIKKQPAPGYFEYALIGLLLLVSIYAIFVTGGKTILLPIPFLLLTWSITDTGNITVRAPKINRKTLYQILALAFLFYFSYYLQSFISWDYSVIKFTGSDHSFYARLATSLNDHGIETYRIAYAGMPQHVPEPYHYTDIWLPALVSAFTGLNTHDALMLVVYPLLAVVAVLGFYETAVYRFGKSLAVLFSSVLLLLFSGVAIFYPSFISGGDVYNVSPSQWPKLLFPVIGLLWAFSNYRKQHPNRFVLSLCIAGLGYINIAPACTIAALLLITQGLVRKEIKLYALWPSALASFVVLCYVYLLYRNGSSTHGIGWPGSGTYFRQAASIFGGGILQFFLWMPLLVLLFLYRKKIQQMKLSRDVFFFSPWQQAPSLPGCSCGRSPVKVFSFFHLYSFR